MKERHSHANPYGIDMNTKQKSKTCAGALHAKTGGNQAQAPVREKFPAGKKTARGVKSRACVKSARKMTGKTCAMPHATKESGTEAREAQSVRGWADPAPLATKPDTRSDTLIRENVWKLIDKRVRELSRDALRAMVENGKEALLVAFAGQICRLEERLDAMSAVSSTATDALTDQSLRRRCCALSPASPARTEDETETLSTIFFTSRENPEEGVTFTIAKDAERMWFAYQDKAERICLENEFHCSLQKWIVQVARDVMGELAAFFHLMASSNPQNKRIISAEEMAQALELGDLLIEHAQEAWSKLKKAQSEAPGKILDLVMRKNWTVFSARDCYQSLNRQLPFYSIKPVNKALAILMEYGCIRPISMKGKNGRAMVRYELNPALQQGREVKCPFVLGKYPKLLP